MPKHLQGNDQHHLSDGKLKHTRHFCSLKDAMRTEIPEVDKIALLSMKPMF
jgi:hypothetical protein